MGDVVVKPGRFLHERGRSLTPPSSECPSGAAPVSTSQGRPDGVFTTERDMSDHDNTPVRDSACINSRDCSKSEVWRHWPGYAEAKQRVQQQSLQDDLKLLDDLFGRDNLKYGDGPEAVKAEALRQLEVEFRSERDERAEFYLGMAKALGGH